MNNKEFVSGQITKLQASNHLYDDAICDVLDIHRTTFYKKKRGLSSFKPGEIKLLAELFNVEEDFITNPNYKTVEPTLSKVNEDAEKYVPVHDPQPRTSTITISVEVPTKGGLKIPEDITEQLLKIIADNQ